MQTNEIGFLKKNHVKPACWRLVKVAFGNGSGKRCWYYVEFNYLGADAKHEWVGNELVSPWNSLKTRRGEMKIFKSTESALSDISSVDPVAVVYLSFGA